MFWELFCFGRNDYHTIATGRSMCLSWVVVFLLSVVFFFYTLYYLFSTPDEIQPWRRRGKIDD